MKEIKPIAFFHSPLTSKFGIPRQSGLSDSLIGKIVFEPQYQREEALRGLDDFDYLWLIWGFSANKSYDDSKLTVRPPRLGGNERLGVFATRSPFRPNGLGLSSVRIKRIVNGVIEVVGADLMDGTPIYDVKPYISYVDSHPTARGGFTDKKEWQQLSVIIAEEYSKCFCEEELTALKEVLSQDPRPQYQHDAARVYGMSFSGKDVKFRVEGNVLEVVGVDN
ncbi:tRNA (N6-threonylcarbamoyladenosine(37)-N6)-methyltransferase TrmO [Prevotella scopos JCM 17725]|jgi:methyltransferase, YaeB family|uniref:tRNA-Thr(GGU) m(6)t(6)A37 methyltransferase TsaA n=1 Tax=Prevotella scopos JCM 17725 TaxID=1236518 RepID=A0AAX2F0W6_9BACT|nr:tRNA (N6-threonylcarbamoyladenosine(37)-N6)-methyltransferase TrmO [Prevotella scopos]ANR73413.1 tRNA-Thr(GGU) m(6)t(6)A37 methyltransferase TsaA [Prevotella scopos JCM 17725]QUB43997.1 tRNA (N6-threonylcarbamoyladenosine(37)-N6)-methyltransferase TrmO [Prevotella scopos JCM 17725]SHF55702.1 tRNA-Thr(GGU) m(6)t(6)A37 methyltransferase TsaA [Prevotella scopos JCM 17725]